VRSLLDILEARRRWPDGPLVLGTVVEVLGSSFRRPGARMLLGEGGRRVGLISGGCLEKDVQRQAWALTEEGPCLATYDTRADELHPDGPYGAGCEGIVRVLLERLPTEGLDPLDVVRDVWDSDRPATMLTIIEGDEQLPVGARLVHHASLRSSVPVQHFGSLVDVVSNASESQPRLVELRRAASTVRGLLEPIMPRLDLLIFGAGDDVLPLTELAGTMGWRVRVADKWPALADPARFPVAERVLCADIEALATKAAIGERTFVLLMTHSLKDDALLLRRAVDAGAAWVGLMGPRRRAARVMQWLNERGALPTPDALSIVAEIQASAFGASARPFHGGESPLHRDPTPLVLEGS
jgi:xanthine/CO dehydrogenase XdhC/CoxF family maturation factor